MSPGTWREAVEVLTKATATTSREQAQVAAATGITLKRGTPRLVAAAHLRAGLSDVLHIRPQTSGSVPDALQELIQKLWIGTRAVPTPQTSDEASAWIEHLYLRIRITALCDLRPERGDIVMTSDGALAEIASIGVNGRIYFTGGMGRGAWPDRVTIIARASDSSAKAETARKSARNAAVSGRPASEWSYARAEELREFRVKRRATNAQLLAFEAVIDSASDERPVQKFLTETPSILAALLRRDECYVIPLKRLGSEHVPDFVVGDTDSAGIHWHLIELESPRAKMFTEDGRSFAKQARKGIEQISDWREWLLSNIAYARTSRHLDGLGLFDIRHDSPGLVLIGRRATLTNRNESQRNQLKNTHTEIHTYDWLLESSRLSSDFDGPPAVNPHALPRRF